VGAQQENLDRLRDAILRHSQTRLPDDATKTNRAAPRR
jgi:hypothetical protein